jgi:hypothetical protein
MVNENPAVCLVFIHTIQNYCTLKIDESMTQRNVIESKRPAQTRSDPIYRNREALLSSTFNRTDAPHYKHYRSRRRDESSDFVNLKRVATGSTAGANQVGTCHSAPL